MNRFKRFYGNNTNGIRYYNGKLKMVIFSKTMDGQTNPSEKTKLRFKMTEKLHDLNDYVSERLQFAKL